VEFDLFHSISQTKVRGVLPPERVVLRNFLDQAEAADRLGFGTLWVAESHLSSEVQKQNPGAVIPHFEGEVGVNVDFVQTATRIFTRTRRIHAGSAILNILCNGGPVAAAERLRAFLGYHGLDPDERRIIEVGFAAGRFPYINAPYGIVPRSPVEAAAWPVVRSKIFREATEIFLRLMKGEVLASDDVAPKTLERSDFRSGADWDSVLRAHGRNASKIELAPTWVFPRLAIVPREVRLELFRVAIGTHEPAAQEFANTIMPCAVFNLSITPDRTIAETNDRMARCYHAAGGPWRRRLMPRTVLVFINEESRLSAEARVAAALEEARDALVAYWNALEGTLDPFRLAQATDNALIGDSATIRDEVARRFHAEDRLMLWFDFNNHDSRRVIRNMEAFMDQVAPAFRSAAVGAAATGPERAAVPAAPPPPGARR
jgi:alkanesulfonate monooxygenase SsuD/methylene tetrahydromethanopterin reductase-like flavin-dependent oxidoreductase (luciferase family)